MIGLTTDIVELHPYTSEWKDEFNKEKEFLLNILSGYDVMIEHVGSTSIEGCPAKPVIDVFIGVESLEYDEHLIPIFVEHGYISKLAAQFPKDRDSYAKGKKEFIETMIFEAQNEIIRKRNKE